MIAQVQMTSTSVSVSNTHINVADIFKFADELHAAEVRETELVTLSINQGGHTIALTVQSTERIESSNDDLAPV